jgi:hypothetical protein
LAIQRALLTVILTIFGSNSYAEENLAGKYRIDCDSAREDFSFQRRCKSELASGVDTSFRLLKDGGGFWKMKPAAEAAETESLQSVTFEELSCFEGRSFLICSVPKNVDSPVGRGYVFRSQSGVIVIGFSGVLDLIKLGE